MFYTAVGINEVVAFHPRCYKDRINTLVMETSDSLWYQLIKSVIAPHQEKDAVNGAINLWEQMAAQIISVVGEDGFNSLYARSVFLAQPKFPWLVAASSLSTQTDRRFAELKRSFEEQTPAQVNEANTLLLITFTGIVTAIIGEQLTIGMLRAAWGNDVSNREFK